MTFKSDNHRTHVAGSEQRLAGSDSTERSGRTAQMAGARSGVSTHRSGARNGWQLAQSEPALRLAPGVLAVIAALGTMALAISPSVRAAETQQETFSLIAPIPLSAEASTDAQSAARSGAAAAANQAVSAERTMSNAISQIRADFAYNRAIIGRGVTVAVLDTGLNVNHAEFRGTGRILAGFNAFDRTTNVNDGHGHGTHVAGLIAASRNSMGMFGVAYGSNVIPIKVLADNGAGSTAQLDMGMRHAVGRAFIANLSLGATVPFAAGTFQQAVRGGMLIVAAAGNRAQPNPDWPARFAAEPWANNQIIAVGAVDANNNLAGFSNRAGVTAPWYLVAPGVGLASTHRDGYAGMSGTSMAAPVVSGAASLIKAMWPQLRADQVANILFITATDLGAPGIDPVFGRGLVNVERALQPVGTVTTTTYNGRSVPVLNTSARVTPGTATIWRLADQGAFQVIGTDDFRRDYSMDVGRSVQSAVAPLSLQQIWGASDSRLDIAERVLQDGSRFLSVTDHRSAMLSSQGALALDGAPAQRLAAFAYSSKRADGLEVAVGSGGLAQHYFGLGGLQLNGMPRLGATSALANPYFTLVPQASYGAMGMTLAGTTYRFGVMTSALSQTLASQYGVHMVGQPQSNAMMFEASRNMGDLAMSFSVSQIGEAGAYLGARSSGVLALGSRAQTTAFQIGAAYRMTDGWALAAQAALGYTPGYSNNDMVINGVSALKTNAFALALIGANRWVEGDRLSVSVSQPMRTFAGSLRMNVLAGIDEQGNEVRENRSFSMVPTARELLTEASYLMPVGKASTAGVSFALRTNPMHLPGVASEQLLAFRFQSRF